MKKSNFKYICFICCSFFFCLVSCTTKKQKNDLITANTKGDVAAILEESFRVKDNFGSLEPGFQTEIRILKFNEDGNLLVDKSEDFLFGTKRSTENFYDNNGLKITTNETSSKFYFNAGFIDEPNIIKYEYDDNENCITEKRYDSEGNIQTSSDFSYNKNKQIISITEKKYERDYRKAESEDDIMNITGVDSVKTNYEYDRKGRLIKTTRIESPKRTVLHFFEYDRFNNAIWERRKHEKESTDTVTTYVMNYGVINYNDSSYIINHYDMDRTLSRKFDKQNNIIYEEVNNKGQLQSRTMRYDEQNNVIYEEVNNEEQSESKTMKYEYDTFGNWIKRIEYDSNLKPKEISIRKYEYYQTVGNKKHSDFELEGEYNLFFKKREYCNEESALSNFLSYMERTYPKWKIYENPEVTFIQDCLYKISFQTMDPYFGGKKETFVVELSINLEEERYYVKQITGFLY